jgi:GMP synthase (glutamine-hydrolysing)
MAQFDGGHAHILHQVPTIGVLHHLDRPSLGQVREPLVAAGLDIVERRLTQGDALPDLDAVDGLVALGGEQSVAGDADGFAAELDYLREAVRREVPVLGVCLGGQLLARALGGEVRHAGRSIEWRQLRRLPAADDDPVFSALPEPVAVLHFNEDVFEPPPGAVELLSRGGEGAEAFRARDCAWGVQYHPDVDAEMLASWIDEYRHWFGGVDIERFRGEGAERMAEHLRTSRALFEAFGRVVVERA